MKKLLISFLAKFGYALVKINNTPKAVSDEVYAKGRKILAKITPDNIILNGPFKGIIYTQHNITEATLVPKLVGSYESQLHQVIEEIITKPYTDILDVGCAEGYYAIGLANRMKDTLVHCYDINEADIEICKNIARLNHLENLTYNNFCSPETLINFNFKQKGLVFCDAEGYEMELFTTDVINALKKHDFLIEVHDIINPSISNTLYERFSATHSIRVFNNRNLDHSGYQGLSQLTEAERAFAFFEHRGGYNMNVHMEWFYITAKEQ